MLWITSLNPAKPAKGGTPIKSELSSSPKRVNRFLGKLTFPVLDRHSDIPVPRDQHSLARDELGAIAGNRDGPVLCPRQPVVIPIQGWAGVGAYAPVVECFSGFGQFGIAM